MCASLAAIDQPSKAKYTAQNASASNTGRRGASSSSAALTARPRSADTPEGKEDNHIFDKGLNTVKINL